jgi:hypothetical protein
MERLMTDPVEIAKARFRADTAEHVLTEVRPSDGVYRHLRFGKPDSGVYGVQIITWPHHLCVVGDMGEWLWRQDRDVLAKFSGDSPDYWAGKLRASGKDDPAYRYDPEIAKDVLTREVTAWDAARPLVPYASVLPDLLESADEGEAVLRHEIANESSGPFTDAWEWDFHGLNPRYLWVCHAVDHVRTLVRQEAAA